MGNPIEVSVEVAEQLSEAAAGGFGNVPSKWSAWSAETKYTALRSVSRNGSSYVCVRACSGVDPEQDVQAGDGITGTYWLLTAKRGEQGLRGESGETPRIGSNGNWYVGFLDTGIPATGPVGPRGESGETPHIGSNGNWYVGSLDTGIPATGPAGKDGQNGAPGSAGKDGVSPKVEVEKTDTGHEVTITDAEGAKKIEVKDGAGGQVWLTDVAGAPGEIILISTLYKHFGHVEATYDKVQVGDRVIVTTDGAVVEVQAKHEKYGFNQLPSVALGQPLYYMDGYTSGTDGKDGVSPTVTVEDVEGGHRVTITDATKTQIFDVLDGKDGKAGQDGAPGSPGKDGRDGVDGVSPVVTVSNMGDGTHKVEVTDKNGTETFWVSNGADAVNPFVYVETIAGGHRVVVEDVSGRQSFDVMDGKDGSDGAPGSPGADGVSPTVQVDAIYGGHKVTITDKNGAQSFDVMDGKDGTGGDGGTQVQADMAQNDETQPDFVKNRTHWKEGGLTEILSETTLDTSNGITPIPGDLALKADTEYTVVWNGTTYTRTARSETYEGIPLVGLGNVDAFAGTGDTGEPFAIAYGAALTSMLGTPNAVIGFDGNESATLSIIADSTVYHKLDNRYIDSEWMASSYYVGSDIGMTVEVPAVTNSTQPVLGFTGKPLKAGDKVRINIVGGTPIANNTYEEKARLSIFSLMYNEDIFCVGNESLLAPGELPDTGEPYLVTCTPSRNQYGVYLETFSEKRVFGIDVFPVKYNTLPERFLPESAKTGTVYVHGNLTDGSTRKETVAEIDTNLKAGKRVIYVHNGGTRYTVLSCSYDTEDNMSYLTMADDSGGIYFIGYVNGWKFERTCGRGTSLPSVSSSDNGKFLRVVNGAWAAVALSNAEGGSF